MPEKRIAHGITHHHHCTGPDFDYINGFHDAANAIATIVSTKVLTPLQAVIWAAFSIFWRFHR